MQKIIPEAVMESSDGYLMVNNDPILWAMLNAIGDAVALRVHFFGSLARINRIYWMGEQLPRVAQKNPSQSC